MAIRIDNSIPGSGNISSHRRFALIIANSNYDDPDLQNLAAAGQDADAFSEVLQNVAIGGFEVKILKNEPSYKVSEEIETFFTDRYRDDLLLLYFSCHGIKDVDGRLYYATINTRRKLLASTAISANFVNEVMLRSRSKRQMLMIDCCYGGAFARGMLHKADKVVHTGAEFEGRGRIVLTASDAMQYSFEGDRREGVGQRSVFTHAVVQGLETGEADMDKNGLVSYTELYNYAYDRVIDETPMQKPGMWVFGLEGDVIVANNPYKKKLDDKAVNELKQAESLPTSSKNVTDDAAKIMSTGISPGTDVEKGKLTPVVPKMEGHGYDTQTGKSKEEYEKEQKPTSIFSPKVLIAIVGVIAVIGAVIAFTLFGHVNPPKIESPVVDEKKVNNLPTANDQSVTTEVNTPVNIALTGSDPDKNDNLTAHTISQPSNGRLGKIDQTTGIVTYTPRTGFNGNDRFAFKVNDGKVDSNQAGNITITIKKLETLGTSNQPPTANDQSVTTEEDKPVNITLTGSDPDKNDNLTAHTLSKPSNGRLGEIDQTTGIVTYTPGTGFVGKDKFTFNTNDGKVNSSNSGTIAITVNRG